jgi:hypothetical protein
MVGVADGPHFVLSETTIQIEAQEQNVSPVPVLGLPGMIAMAIALSITGSRLLARMKDSDRVT